MAGLSFKRLFISLCAMAVFCHSAYSYESSFPFPFEFGHSSDIYFTPQKKETKEIKQEVQAANDLLSEMKISKSPNDFVKYIKKNEAGKIKLLLEAGFDPNTNINASFPLYYAAKYNRKQIIYMLLEKGANPNKDLTSPMRFTILHKDWDSTKALIDAGGNVNYLDMMTDESLLYTALKKKQYEIAMLLLNKGAKIDKKTYLLIKRKKLEPKLGIMLN